MRCILPPEDPGELSLEASVVKEVGRSRPLDHEVNIAVRPRRGPRDRSKDGEVGAVLPAPALDHLPMGIDELPYPPSVAEVRKSAAGWTAASPYRNAGTVRAPRAEPGRTAVVWLPGKENP